MNASTIDEKSIRRYLLGQAPEAEQQQVEETLLVDDDFGRQIGIAEDELIEEYLAGELDAAERSSFELHFLAARQRRENLEFSRALRRYIEEHPQAKDTATSARWWLRPQLAYAVATAAVLAVAWLAGNNATLRNQLAQRETQPAAVAAPTTTVLTLTPGLLRSGGEMQVIEKRPAGMFVEMHLQLPADAPRLESYSASLATVEGDEVWRQARLQRDGETVKVAIPTSVLTRGDWKIAVAGAGANGKPMQVASYYFRVTFE